MQSRHCLNKIESQNYALEKENDCWSCLYKVFALGLSDSRSISIELNAKINREDVKIATDYNCFAKNIKI